MSSIDASTNTEACSLVRTTVHLMLPRPPSKLALPSFIGDLPFALTTTTCSGCCRLRRNFGFGAVGAAEDAASAATAALARSSAGQSAGRGATRSAAVSLKALSPASSLKLTTKSRPPSPLSQCVCPCTWITTTKTIFSGMCPCGNLIVQLPSLLRRALDATASHSQDPSGCMVGARHCPSSPMTAQCNLPPKPPLLMFINP
mmetsp:Transcript_35240/g.64411  ORF Transcript_35240/g.64411 Transcript_35240/m.64411 type:complete len:202 (+) Transcript_35240:3225-3830(+)